MRFQCNWFPFDTFFFFQIQKFKLISVGFFYKFSKRKSKLSKIEEKNPQNDIGWGMSEEEELSIRKIIKKNQYIQCSFPHPQINKSIKTINDCLYISRHHHLSKIKYLSIFSSQSQNKILNCFPSPTPPLYTSTHHWSYDGLRLSIVSRREEEKGHN